MNKEETNPPEILSTSKSTPSLAKTNISFTNGTGIPSGNNWGFRAFFYDDFWAISGVYFFVFFFYKNLVLFGK